MSTMKELLPPSQTSSINSLSLEKNDVSDSRKSSFLDLVPVEIWQHIFLALLSSETVPALDEIFGSVWGRTASHPHPHGKVILPRTPSVISRVCSRWRKCASGMPDLWNIFYVRAPRANSATSAQGITQLVKRHLSLSRSMPLKICIDSKSDEEVARLLMRAIIPFSSRWETIHLLIPPNALSELCSLRPHDLPRLTSLKTHMQIHALGTVDISQLHLFECIPPIRRFCTSSLPPQICHIYAGLEELHIQENRSETWSTVPVLAACLKLRVLSLSGVGITMSSTTAFPDLVLPELHTLNLEHPTGRERLLDMMVLPRLRTLTIGGSCSGESTRSVISAIIMMMDRSEVESLTSLSLSFERHTTDSALLISFLCRNPCLKKLRIDDTWKFINHRPFVTACLLQALTYLEIDGRPSMPYLCPRLETISLEGCSDFDDDTLLVFINSRCWPGRVKSDRRCPNNSGSPGDHYLDPASLNEVGISIRRKFGGNLLDVAESWRRMGFSIDLRRAL